MHSLGINGESKLSRQPVYLSLPGKYAVKTECCVYIFEHDIHAYISQMHW